MIWLLLLWAAAASAGEGRQVTDLLGRRVTVPDSPRRVVALAPNITEMVYAVGRGDLLVGVTRFSDFPEAALSLPKVGSYVQLDLERIVSLKPDLCIAIKDGNPKEVIDRLEGLGIPVFAMDPRDLETVLETLVQLGNLLHAEPAASRLVNDMRERVRKVEARVAGVVDRPKVFFQIGIDPIVSVGSETFIDKLITRAGGVNLAAGAAPYPRFSKEQVLSLAPDVLIITSMARGAVFERVKAEWEQWPDMPAVRSGRVFIQDTNLFDRPSPRLVKGLEVLASLIHPERFPESQ